MLRINLVVDMENMDHDSEEVLAVNVEGKKTQWWILRSKDELKESLKPKKVIKIEGDTNSFISTATKRHADRSQWKS